MKITIFTSNQRRHIFLINTFSKIAKEIFVIQECTTMLPGIKNGIYKKSKDFGKYFENVAKAEKKFFKKNTIEISRKCKLKLLPIQFGDINHLKTKNIKEFLKSDIFIVFGTGYIKKQLCNFLIKKKTINIHMGISPYYRGSNCNFWAIQDNNPHLVGATIHLLDKKIDNGKILYHAISEYEKNPFVYSMSTVKSAIISLKKKIEKNKILKIKPIRYKKKNIRYSLKKEFTSKLAKNFLKKKIEKFNFKKNFNFIRPFILLRKDYFK